MHSAVIASHNRIYNIHSIHVWTFTRRSFEDSCVNRYKTLSSIENGRQKWWEMSLGEGCHTFIPLSHYSRNAPRIHNICHIFQIAKVPSGVCKIRPAFLLDSATFLAIASAGGNVQEGSCVSGRYFTFSKIREFIKNPIQQTYERTEYNTMKQESNRTLVRTFVGIYWDIVENVKITRRLYQELYEPNTNAIRYHSFGHSIQHCYHC